MKSDMLSTKITLWVNRFVAALVVALLFALPAILKWYCTIRFLDDQAQTAITIAFYCCAVFILIALWSLDRLLRNILKNFVFVRSNVRSLRHIRLCCAAVSLCCLPAAFYYPPLLFLSLIMGFLFLVVGVVCQVMKAAVAIREENALTI